MGEDLGPVLVTGFGPFGHHTVNASWIAVQELQKTGVQGANSQSVPLVTKEVPVVYDAVKETVPRLLSELKPRLCVHVGVSPYKKVVLEQCGRNTEYCKRDVNGKTPVGECCVAGGQECLYTKFNVQKVVVKASEKQPDIEFASSTDAGRYLCDFIYYTSLHVNSTPVLFVHVCPLEKPYSAHQLGKALKAIIEVVLAELDSA